MSRKSRVFWPLLIVTFLTDCTTKESAVENLGPPGVHHDILGDFLRFTLAYNNGAAMSLPLGSHAKEVLGLIALIMATILFVWYRRAPQTAALLPAALAFLLAGGLGNAWGRLLTTRGVVDFIDIGTSSWRFYVFNVADVAVCVGAGLLVVEFWREERRGRVGERA